MEQEYIDMITILIQASVKAYKNGSLQKDYEKFDDDFKKYGEISKSNTELTYINGIPYLFKNVSLPDTAEIARILMDSEGNVLGTLVTDAKGKSDFQVSNYTNNKVKSSITGKIQGKGDYEEINLELDKKLPKSMEELQRRIKNRTLILRNYEDIVAKSNGKPGANLELSESSQKEYGEQAVQDIPVLAKFVNYPEYVKECIANETAGKTTRVLQVLRVTEAASINQHLDKEGLIPGKGDAYMVVLSDDTLSGRRVILLQSDRNIDRRENDEISELADSYYPVGHVNRLDDKSSYYFYTTIEDEHGTTVGNTVVGSLTKEPKDLTLEMKKELVEELTGLIQEKNEINKSDMSTEAKARFCLEKDEEILNTLDRYGIDLPELRKSIEESLKEDRETLINQFEVDEGSR